MSDEARYDDQCEPRYIRAYTLQSGSSIRIATLVGTPHKGLTTSRIDRRDQARLAVRDGPGESNGSANDTQLLRCQHSLDPVARVQFSHRTLEIRLDGIGQQAQYFGYLTIARTSGHVFENLDLAGPQ